MIDITRTTTQLLNDLQDPQNQQVWETLDSRYRPVIVNFVRKLGLNDADAADVAQETLIQFIREYRDGRYDRERGRLRSWIITIARYKVAAARRSKARGGGSGRGDSVIVNLEDEAELTRVWEAERRTVLLRQAMEQLKATSRASDKTIQAFELLVTRHMAAPDVAEALEMGVHDVYLAKSRCTARLRKILDQLEAAYAGE
ncbi:MAG: sigma-70 family RNA polymerase sigma factor [Phycisphaerales bacterium]|nr:sigma-70 family RNA polymerase sigma factor [Phycisphaerales bacterium]